ncbi:DIS3-like exonuclease 2 isoform X2 [Bacillus rossius redtenbacheri]
MVASDGSSGALADIVGRFNTQGQGSTAGAVSLADPSQGMKENTPGNSGAVPKKAAKPRSRNRRGKRAEDGSVSRQVTYGTKSEEESLDQENAQPPNVPAPNTQPDLQKTSSKKVKKKPKSSQSRNNEEVTFNNYLLEEELQKERENGCLLEGVIRINQRNFKEAYINSPDKGQDILIDGIRDRNRALEGDEVIVRLKSSDQWRVQGSDTQKTAEVVSIKCQNHPRAAVGTLKLMADKNPNFALFSPRDSRVPRLRIPMSKCPQDFPKRAAAYGEVLFMARITSWFDVRYAVGELTKCLGTIGDKTAETQSILLENEIDVTPYPDSFRDFYPQSFVIEEELDKRLDLRKECIFTIDPLTARDLDDALSCKRLDNGNFEIGVHISDVTYFLAEGTPLDVEVSKRATSTYLVDEVFHMLPRELCMLCSLLPGSDRLAFSVFWEMSADAEVLGRRFARTLISSCAQLAYEHAQEMIDNPAKVWRPEELPPIHNGFSPSDLVQAVQALHGLALKLRGERFSNGALRIDQTKLVFHLHPVVGLPVSFTQHVNKESHRMIEEFMLLANMTVAGVLKERFPDVAFLRAHARPHERMMKELQATMGSVGVHLDVSSAGGLQASLGRHAGADLYGAARLMVLNLLCAKPMARAKYFCAKFADTDEDYWHYALSAPLYTHFTSPIRRYADVMVHRLLAAAMGYVDKPDWSVDKVQKIAANCNKQKFNAKRAGEQSSDLFLTFYVAQFGPLVEDAVVLDVKDHSFDVIVLSMGCNLRIYTNSVPDMEPVFRSEGKVSTLELHWKPCQGAPEPAVQIVQIFSILKVVVSCSSSSVRLEAHLLRPGLVQ